MFNLKLITNIVNCFLFSFLLQRLIKNKNAYLEHNAVRRCHLESHHHILEVGFGPGIGLKAACEIIKDGTLTSSIHSTCIGLKQLNTSTNQRYNSPLTLLWYNSPLTLVMVFESCTNMTSVTNKVTRMRPGCSVNHRYCYKLTVVLFFVFV